MKKIFIAPLVTMLLVGCQLVIVAPSSSMVSSEQASISSNTSTPSSITNSSSTNSSTSTDSSSSSSSEDPINIRKVPFNQIGSLVAQVVDAKAMGIVNSKDRAPLNGRRNAEGDDQNYMVKVTETYNIETKVTEEETAQVTLVKITNTQTTELQTGTESYLATSEPLNIERLTDLPGNIVISNVPEYEFRALNGDIVLQDWTSSDQPTIEFLFERLESGTFNKVASAEALDIVPITNDPGNIVFANNPEYEFRLMDGGVEVIPWQAHSTTNVEFIFNSEITNPTIEYRGINALITFESISNLTYDISFNGETIIDGLVDNGPSDLDSDLGTISINGLTEGFTYEVAYSGEVPNHELTNIIIESRSLNASISFIAFEGFTYTIKQGETVIYEDIEDNDEPDTNEAVGNITLSGLTEGLTYNVTYAGYRVIETITQDEVEGQVDKLYVLYQYTFISFVPLNVNDRPQDKDLELDYDGVPLYDKQGYFSDSTRQSFVVDNDTGLIYKIENINIASLSGGCVTVQGNPFPFDLKTNENGSVDFNQIFSNSTLRMDHCIKDKNGNIFIQNDKLNYFDESKNVTYYVFNNNDSNPFIGYWLNSNYETVKINYVFKYNWTSKTSGFVQPFNSRAALIESIQIYENNDNSRDITVNDTFDIYDQGESSTLKRYQNFYTIFVKDGFAYAYQKVGYGFFGGLELIKFNPSTGSDWLYYTYYSVPARYDSTYLEKYGILIEWHDNKLYVIEDVWSKVDLFFEGITTGPGNDGFYKYFQENNGPISLKAWTNSTIIINGCQISEVKDENGYQINKVMTFTPSGNIYYDMILTESNGTHVVEPYVVGTYIAPPITSVTLQPINR